MAEHIKSTESSRRSFLQHTVVAGAAASVLWNSSSPLLSNEADEKKPLLVVVMDPLAAPLACDCVQGYAQRKYEKLGEYLEQRLKKPVKVVWNGSLIKALESEDRTSAALVIGKDSVVRTDMKNGKLALRAAASLTGLDGSTTQTGVFVVRSKDKAVSLLDIDNYQILFGPEDAEEKSSAPKETLEDLEVTYTEGETCPSCSESAKALMALPEETKAAAVISSYATPLLEGCGAVKKGDLRIIGKSSEVPFITAFIDETLTQPEQAAISAALLEMEDPELRKILETKNGFVPYSFAKKK